MCARGDDDANHTGCSNADHSEYVAEPVNDTGCTRTALIDDTGTEHAVVTGDDIARIDDVAWIDHDVVANTFDDIDDIARTGNTLDRFDLDSRTDDDIACACDEHTGPDDDHTGTNDNCTWIHDDSARTDDAAAWHDDVFSGIDDDSTGNDDTRTAW